jgi:predicted chitinase
MQRKIFHEAGASGADSALEAEQWRSATVISNCILYWQAREGGELGDFGDQCAAERIVNG